MSEYDVEHIAMRMQQGIQAVENAKFTVQQVSDALISIAPALDAAWLNALNNDAIWNERAKRHGWLQTWRLRYQMKASRRI